MLSTLRTQAEEYGADIVVGKVLSLHETPDGFAADTTIGPVRASRVVMATGLTDRCPDIEVLDRAESDDVVGKLKVSAVLQAMPGIGKIRATQIMEKLKIADSRRLRGLGDQQRKALLAEFATAGK